MAENQKRTRRDMLQAMQAAGLPPHLVYAYERTGLFPNEVGYRRMSARLQAEWRAAIEEYFQLHAQSAAGRL